MIVLRRHRLAAARAHPLRARICSPSAATPRSRGSRASGSVAPVIAAHVLCSVFAGLAGLLLASRLGVGSPTAAPAGWLRAALHRRGRARRNLAASAARGSIWGTIGGVASFAVVDNVMSVMQVNPFLKDVVRGVVIVAAVAVYARRRIVEQTGTVPRKGPWKRPRPSLCPWRGR